MRSEQDRADALHEAIESGRGLPEARGRRCAADAREETSILLGAAHWLREAFSARADRPRPSFVLSLEEQLRADLSLMRTPTPFAPGRALSGRTRTVTVAAVLCLACAGAISTARSQPGERMYPLKRAVETSYNRVMAHGEDRVDRWLQLGRRRLDEVEWALGHRPDLAHRLINDTVDAYGSALDAARSTGRHDLVVRAVVEAGEAAESLDRLATTAAVDSPPASAWLLAAARSLTEQLALGPGSTDDLESTAFGLPAPPSSGRVVDVPVAPATPLASPTAPAPAPTRPALVTPTATPVVEATPIRAETPPRPRPTDLPVTAPVDPPFTPPAVSPGASPTISAAGTNTPDRWPVTTTALPAAPIATVAGPATAVPGQPSPKVPPTTAWPTEPGGGRAPDLP